MTDILAIENARARDILLDEVDRQLASAWYDECLRYITMNNKLVREKAELLHALEIAWNYMPSGLLKDDKDSVRIVEEALGWRKKSDQEEC